METALSTVLPLLHLLCLAILFVGLYRAIIILVKFFRAMSVMLFVGVYRAIIILVKFFPKRHERRYLWKPMSEKEAIDRVNAVLQRKLEEVESGIGRLLEHPPSTYIHDDDDDDRKVSLYRTARKIDFIKNLLAAEMNSRSPHWSENLNRMATRLSILQKAFVEWAFANGVESTDNDGAVDKCPDTSASGSCTKSKVETRKHEKGKRKFTTEEKGKWKVMEDEKENERNQEEEGSKVEATKRRRKGDTVEEQTKRRKEALAEIIDEKKPGRQRKNRGVRSCMAMGCAAIAGLISLVALSNIPPHANIPYVEDLVPT